MIRKRSTTNVNVKMVLTDVIARRRQRRKLKRRPSLSTRSAPRVALKLDLTSRSDMLLNVDELGCSREQIR
jgi:hypothetical protein